MFDELLSGLRFVQGEHAILAALSLDLFSVFLGGAEALLPVFAAEILHVGPQGLGLLRAAPAAGAVTMGIFLAHRPPFQRAGPDDAARGRRLRALASSASACRAASTSRSRSLR